MEITSISKNEIKIKNEKDLRTKTALLFDDS